MKVERLEGAAAFARGEQVSARGEHLCARGENLYRSRRSISVLL